MPNLSNPTLLIVVVAVIVMALLVVAWLLDQQRRRRAHLRERFGPEYDRTVKSVGTTGKAEAVLTEREKRVATYHIRALSPEERARFADAWSRVQAKFVDDPSATVTDKRLEEQWERNDKVSTEDLRQAMHRYRSFFERLLSM